MGKRLHVAVRILLGALAGLIVVAGIAGVAGWWLLSTETPPEPDLTGRLADRTVTVGARERGYRLYVPARSAPDRPLVVVFHGSMGTPDTIRVETGYEFDRLADEHGFVVAYPQGVAGNWNDCRRAADYPARTQNVDDVGLLRAIVAQTAREHGVDPRRVFVAGLSSGGSFALRLAQEHPEAIAGAAVFAAGLPTPANSVCAASTASVPVLLVSGADDPINPYAGGEVSMFGFASRGEVMSARATAQWFARRAGAAAPTTRRIDPPRPDGTSVDRAEWPTDAGPAVVLLSVNGGGHVAPQPVYRARRLLGRTTSAINGPEEAWTFFSALPSPTADPQGR